MYSRGFHHKSRNGCRQCKRRHIKCNFQGPICSNCVKKGIYCDYQIDFIQDNRSRVANASLCQPALLPSTSSMPREALLSLYPEESSVLMAYFKQAGPQPFLRHSMLSVSSLYQGKGASVSKAAIGHQLQASRLFRCSISSITEQNWLSALAFAVSVAIFHLRTTRETQSHCTAEILFVFRSCALIIDDIKPWFHGSGLSAQLRKGREQRELPPSLHEITVPMEALQSLEELVMHSHGVGSSQSACLHAILQLKRWLHSTMGKPKTWLDLAWWPASVSSDYLALVREEEPISIIIFIHWCAVMKNAPRAWFLEGWAETVAASVAQRMVFPNQRALAWAISVLGIRIGETLPTGLGNPFNGKPQLLAAG